MAFYRVRQSSQTRNEFVVMGADAQRSTRAFVNRGKPHDDQTHTPFCSFLIKIDQLVRHFIIPAHDHIHGRHDDAVCDRHPIDQDRFK
jgi:hypothetical protein